MSMGGVANLTIECGPGRTKQSMKAETDINNILRRYIKTGLVEHVARGVPQFIDVSEVGDYRTALANVRAADEWFSKLPARVRERFSGDTAAFMDFMLDPSNTDEAVGLGLAVADKEPAVDRPAVDEVPGPGVQHRGADGRFESPK